MMQQKNLDIDMIEEVLFVTPINWKGFHPSDSDIDKIYCRTPKELDNTAEAIAYRKIRNIANSNECDIKWGIVIKELTNSILLIYDLIKTNTLKYPEELKEFTENAIAIMETWDRIYRTAFNDIKSFRDSYKAPKSIDEMNADELREYIKKHNIK